MPYFGTNGFYLPFSDNSSVAALGYDFAGTASYNATVAGNTQISTAVSKYGGSSAYFDGSGDYLSATSTELAIGTADFTVEFWMYATNVTGFRRIFTNNTGNFDVNTLCIRIDSATSKLALYVGDGSISTPATISAIQVNTWYHVAVTRSGSTINLYLDGVFQSGFSATGIDLNKTTFVVGGHNSTTTEFFLGYMDDLRVYKGVAKYTSNFTVPASSLPIGKEDPYWGYCIFALPMTGTNASVTFPVYKTNSWTPTNFSVSDGSASSNLTLGGTAALSKTRSKTGGTSLSFASSASYAQMDGSAKFNFGTGDFTIEAWVYFNTVGNYDMIDFRPSGTYNGPYISLYYDGIVGSPQIRFLTNWTNYIYSGIVNANAWYHIALTRASGTTRMFLNGNLSGTYTDSVNYGVGASRPSLGGSGYSVGTAGMDGYLENVIIYKGYAKYTSNFTPLDNPGLFVNQVNKGSLSAFAPMNGVSGSTTVPYYYYSVGNAAGNDSLIDSPTSFADGNTNVGNHATITAGVIQTQYAVTAPASTGGTLSNANLDVLGQASNWNGFIGSVLLESGKWYWEVTNVAEPTVDYSSIGIIKVGTLTSYAPASTAYAAGDILGFALDLSAGTFVWYKNGISQATLATGLTESWLPWCQVANSNSLSFNFGQRPFAYTPPSGFKSINTYNLP